MSERPNPDAALDGRLAFVGAAAIALVLLASPASAHCYSIWRFSHPQPGCFVHAHVAGRAAWAARREVMRIDRRYPPSHRITPDTRAGQQVRTDAPDESAIAILRAAMEKK